MCYFPRLYLGQSSSTSCRNVYRKQIVEFVAGVHHVEQVSWQISPDHTTWFVRLPFHTRLKSQLCFAIFYWARYVGTGKEATVMLDIPSLVTTLQVLQANLHV